MSLKGKDDDGADSITKRPEIEFVTLDCLVEKAIEKIDLAAMKDRRHER